MRRLFSIISFMFICALSFAQTYEEFVTQAMDYTDKGEYLAAQPESREAAQQDKGNILLLVNLGTVQRNLGKHDEALLSYNIALENYPQVPLILHSRASLLCEMNKLGEAMADYNTILKVAPDDVEALYRRALIYMTNKLPLAAKADFEQMCLVDKNNLLGQMGLAMIMKRNGEWTEAEELYTDLIYKHKTNADLYFNRAECYFQLNKLARTQEDLMKATEYGYNEAPLFILRGQLRLAQYDKLSAKEDFLKAKEKGADAATIDQYLKLCR